MKELYLLRHAKSSWDSPANTDHERPLNRRGLNDAPEMAARLATRGDLPNKIICSSAVRAQTTAALIAEGIGYKLADLKIEANAYSFSADDVIEQIKSLDSQYESVMLVGHNPAYTIVANLFSPEPISNVSTCGLVKLVSESSQWQQLEPANTRLVYFDYPKNKREV